MAVYFIQAGEGGPVKIGQAKDARKRLMFMQPGNHLELNILREIPGGFDEERWLHKHYEGRRIRGEWFHYCDTMLSVLPKVESNAAELRRPLAAASGMLGDVLTHLEKCRGRWNAIAEESGVPAASVQRIGSRKTLNPGYENIQKLHDYFERAA